jgi:succinate dehydrogenase / fumarate reductase membrane anchor subunit
MSDNFGSKRVVVGAHYGLRDWIMQRATAVLMALFTLIVIAQVLTPGEMSYEKWSGIFAHQWMKVLTFITIASILWHAWVGVRDVLMDYVTQLAPRLVLQVAAIAWLVGCAGWALQVLWRI